MSSRRPESELPTFGRKLAPRGVADRRRHAALLRLLRTEEAANPHQRARLAGRALFDAVHAAAAESKTGARGEDLLAIIAVIGGVACLEAALDQWRWRGETPAAAGLSLVQGTDGRTYVFGDLLNRFLLESPQALLSLALGAAHDVGGETGMAMVQDTMRHVALTVGGPDFARPRLLPEHRPYAPPLAIAREWWPWAAAFLTDFEVPAAQRPAAIGYALQRAIHAGKAALHPTLAARIVVECAVPLAKLHPQDLF